MCLFVCTVDHRVTKEEPVDEQYHEKVFKDQYHEPEPKGQYFDQYFPEGFVNGKSNSILWPAYLTQFFKHNLSACFT